MANLYPYIMSDDANAQAAFYVKALGGEILFVKTFADMPNNNPHRPPTQGEQLKDKVMHLRFKAAGLIFLMSDSVREPVKRGTNLDLTLEFANEAEAQQAFDGLAQGGKVILPFAKQFWGSSSGIVEDPFGIRWQITTAL